MRNAGSGALLHGGDLSTARRHFPHAPTPLIDLSTGINPFPYPIPPLAPELFARLPDAAAAIRLSEIAAAAYGAPNAANVVSASGTQILLPLVAALVPPGAAAILGPTYAEHARAAQLAGHRVREVRKVDDLFGATLSVVVNPNNPDGQLVPREQLLALATEKRRAGGLLVVDEAFMDVAPPGYSLAADVEQGGIVVLRSFGKFFGLAGVRLGFAIAARDIAARIAATLGPWAVAGPTLAIGAAALADASWIASMRDTLEKRAARLDRSLSEAGLAVIGGTSLFRLIEITGAAALFEHLGRAGILVRHFPEHPTRLRFGLPPNAAADARLRAALGQFCKRR